MDREEVKLVIILASIVLVILVVIGVMGYTKAQNDQEYYSVVGSEMSEEDFAEFMDDEQLRRSGG